MIIGTVAILAYYGLLPPEYRYSRAIIIFTGFAGTGILLGMHELLYRMGILRFIPYDKLPHKAVIVADEQAYQQTSEVLRKVNYAPELAGRISPSANKANALASITEMKQLLYVTNVNEVIFCVNGLTYSEIFHQMQTCGSAYEYKIHLPGGSSFVGSNSSATSGDLYTIDRRYALGYYAQLRNKRVLDIAISILFLLFAPVLLFKVSGFTTFISNCFKVISGKRTWVGYAPASDSTSLPKLRKGIIGPYNYLPGYQPSPEVLTGLNLVYAQHYTSATDINLILNNLRYLGK